MNSTHGLTKETVARIHKVLTHYPEVERAILYGSRAKGNFKPGSDIDLALVGDGLTLKILGEIEDEMFEGPLAYTFDLSVLKHIKQADLFDHIQRVGVLFYDRKPLPVSV